MTTTTLNLFVNGQKVHTRKTTAKHVTHALVGRFDNGEFLLTNCSTRGPGPLDGHNLRRRAGWQWRSGKPSTVVVEWFVLPVVNNTVTLAV